MYLVNLDELPLL